MISHWRTSVTRVMIHSVNTFPVREGNTLTVDNPVSDDTSLLEITLHVKQNYWIAADSLEDCNFVIATSRWLLRSRWKTTQDWCMRMMMSFGRARERAVAREFVYAPRETGNICQNIVNAGTRYSSHNVFHIRNATCRWKNNINHVILKWKRWKTITVLSWQNQTWACNVIHFSWLSLYFTKFKLYQHWLR